LEEEIADLDARMARGKELLEAGFPMEALREFEYCLGKELMYPRAWQGLAAAHKRLGHEDESEQCLERAEYFRGKLVQPLIEAEARAQHPLFGKNR
jgi:predicted Zn-dependent protease